MRSMDYLARAFQVRKFDFFQDWIINPASGCPVDQCIAHIKLIRHQMRILNVILFVMSRGELEIMAVLVVHDQIFKLCSDFLP